MAAFSLLLSEWGWRNRATANFYLAPTRAWELFAGSAAAFIVQKNGLRKSNLLALFGLAAIVISILVYDETTTFPSVYALVPVLGVVMLILFADKETVATKLLSTKGFVGVGLVSYSAIDALKIPTDDIIKIFFFRNGVSIYFQLINARTIDTKLKNNIHSIDGCLSILIHAEANSG